MHTVTVDPRTCNVAGSSSGARACAAYPKFIIQHTWPAHHKVVSTDPSANGRSVDGVDYADFDEAAAQRDRLNAAAGCVAS